jgi:hypothetical protein
MAREARYSSPPEIKTTGAGVAARQSMIFALLTAKA